MATLKISDISIGDYVCYCDRVYKVYSIEESGLVRADNESYSCPHIMKNINDIDPIPITAEMLEKNGFDKPREDVWNDSWYWNDGAYRAITLSEVRGRWYMRSITKEHDDIQIGIGLEYVHQLQHALSLAGVDKEINL